MRRPGRRRLTGSGRCGTIRNMNRANSRDAFLNECDAQNRVVYEALFDDIQRSVIEGVMCFESDEATDNLSASASGTDVRLDFTPDVVCSLKLEDRKKLVRVAPLLWFYPNRRSQQPHREGSITVPRDHLIRSGVPADKIDAYESSLVDDASFEENEGGVILMPKDRLVDVFSSPDARDRFVGVIDGFVMDVTR